MIIAVLILLLLVWWDLHSLSERNRRLIMADIDTLNQLAQGLSDEVTALAETIATENGNIDKALAALGNLPSSPDLTTAINLLTGAKTNLDTASQSVTAENAKLVAALPPSS